MRFWILIGSAVAVSWIRQNIVLATIPSDFTETKEHAIKCLLRLITAVCVGSWKCLFSGPSVQDPLKQASQGLEKSTMPQNN